MKPLHSLLAVALLLQSAFAADPFHVYAPSRTTDQLWVIEAQPGEGTSLRLNVLETVEVGFSPATITQHPTEPLLYLASNRGEPGQASGAAVRLADSGKVESQQRLTLQHGYSYLSLDRANRFLLGVNYGGGFVDVYALDEAGTPGDRVAFLDEGRRNAHCVLPAPDNRFVYIPYVKDTNALYQYSFDPETGSLSALDPLDAGPPEGTGPRHLAYHPSKPLLYFSNEQHLGVSVYEKLPSGMLQLRQVCDASIEAQDGVSSSDIVITPDGKYLFAGIRGHKKDVDAVSRYRVLESGEVEFLGLTPADAIPWGFALSPDGKFLVVTAFRGGTLTAYAVQANGELAKAASLEWDESISDVVCR